MDDTGDTSSLDDDLARQVLQQQICRLQHDRRLKAAEFLLTRYPPPAAG